MAKVTTESSNYTAIADAIRAKTGGTTQYKPSEMPVGVDEAFAAGMQSEYDRFWDTFQQNGNRTAYNFSLCGKGWNAATFRPKYSIRPTVCPNIFAYWDDASAGMVDLVELCEELGIEIDTSKATSMDSMFNSNTIVCRVGAIDTTSADKIGGLFHWCLALRTIEKLIFRNDGTQTINDCFLQCNVLENLTIEGVIGTSGTNCSDCKKLSKTSIISVVNALSSTTSGLSVTFSNTAVNNAFTTEEWATLAATKPNWTINLV